MNSAERIEHGGALLALVIRAEVEVEGPHFVTPASSPLQLGLLGHKQGIKIKPHFHRESERVVRQIQEVLHMDRGKMKANFYDSDGREVASTILKRGDTLLLMSGGHGFDILEDSRILEVKQGPYGGVEEDKQHIDV